MSGAVVLALMIVSLLALPGIASAAEPTGTIEGSVFNATKKADVPNQEVTLKTLLNGNEVGTKTVKTNAEGRFTVEGLSVSSGYTYQVTLNYQEADYTSDTVDFASGADKKQVKVTVWDSTKNGEAIKVQVAHTIIVAEQAGLQVKSYAVFENPTELTYIGSKQLAPDKKETLKFYVPPGVKNLQYGQDLMGCCVLPTEGGFSDTMSVEPGTKEALYSYVIPYNSATYTFAQKFDYPTASYDLLIQGDGIVVGGGKLARLEPVSIEGKEYSRFAIGEVAAGDTINVELSGLPQGKGQRVLKWVGMWFLVVAFGFGLLHLARRRRPRLAPVKAGASLGSEKRRLLAELARLDDAFETGTIDEGIYHRQRAEKKQRLLRLMRTSTEGN